MLDWICVLILVVVVVWAMHLLIYSGYSRGMWIPGARVCHYGKKHVRVLLSQPRGGPHGLPMWTPWVPWGPHEVPWGPHGVPMTFSPLIILMPAAAMPTPRSRSSSPNPPLSYHPRWCCTCQCWFNGQVQYQDHKQGRRHQRKLLKLPPPP